VTCWNVSKLGPSTANTRREHQLLLRRVFAMTCYLSVLHRHHRDGPLDQ
jgi:hypothetical protein